MLYILKKGEEKRLKKMLTPLSKKHFPSRVLDKGTARKEFPLWPSVHLRDIRGKGPQCLSCQTFRHHYVKCHPN